jgi:hypothetical protein
LRPLRFPRLCVKIQPASGPIQTVPAQSRPIRTTKLETVSAREESPAFQRYSKHFKGNIQPLAPPPDFYFLLSPLSGRYPEGVRKLPEGAGRRRKVPEGVARQVEIARDAFPAGNVIGWHRLTPVVAGWHRLTPQVACPSSPAQSGHPCAPRRHLRKIPANLPFTSRPVRFRPLPEIYDLRM